MLPIFWRLEEFTADLGSYAVQFVILLELFCLTHSVVVCDLCVSLYNNIKKHN